MSRRRTNEPMSKSVCALIDTVTLSANIPHVITQFVSECYDEDDVKML